MERRKHPRVSVRLPLEYWESDDARHGGYVENVSEMGLAIYSIQDYPVDTHLGVKVFFSSGSEFDGFQVRTRIAWKAPHREPQWKGYLLGLEFTAISDEDRNKLVSFLGSRIPPEARV
jgi:c-di-GMP-binding flagellar brake protein YcgR